MKSVIKLLILFFISIAFLHCDRKNRRGSSNVAGQLPPAPNPIPVSSPSPIPVSSPNPVAQKPVYAYGAYFNVQGNTLYKRLLETCRRCGLKRLVQGPYGTHYQKYWTTHQDPKRCENWISRGYIQIEFVEDKLPTTAKVLIQPKYTGAVTYDYQGKEQEIWGEAFEIQALARPINENDGFEILVNPNDGIFGVYTLSISSRNTNHVKNSALRITVNYGQKASQTIISQTITKLEKRAVPPAQFSCSQYTN